MPYSIDSESMLRAHLLAHAPNTKSNTPNPTPQTPNSKPQIPNQVLERFVVDDVTTPGLFVTAPSLTKTGALSFELAPDVTGISAVAVFLKP